MHVRAGAEIVKTAPTSITVPGALSPVRCEPEHGYAVYVEPKAWVRHVL